MFSLSIQEFPNSVSKISIEQYKKFKGELTLFQNYHQMIFEYLEKTF